MRVWHDNSGKGKFGSWYLNYVVVRDVQSDTKQVFVANKWLAVEEDDGQVHIIFFFADIAFHCFKPESIPVLCSGLNCPTGTVCLKTDGVYNKPQATDSIVL